MIAYYGKILQKQGYLPEKQYDARFYKIDQDLIDLLRKNSLTYFRAKEDDDGLVIYSTDKETQKFLQEQGLICLCLDRDPDEGTLLEEFDREEIELVYE